MIVLCVTLCSTYCSCLSLCNARRVCMGSVLGRDPTSSLWKAAETMVVSWLCSCVLKHGKGTQGSWPPTLQCPLVPLGEGVSKCSVLGRPHQSPPQGAVAGLWGAPQLDVPLCCQRTVVPLQQPTGFS